MNGEAQESPLIPYEAIEIPIAYRVLDSLRSVPCNPRLECVDFHFSEEEHDDTEKEREGGMAQEEGQPNAIRTLPTVFEERKTDRRECENPECREKPGGPPSGGRLRSEIKCGEAATEEERERNSSPDPDRAQSLREERGSNRAIAS